METSSSNGIISQIVNITENSITPQTMTSNQNSPTFNLPITNISENVEL